MTEKETICEKIKKELEEDTRKVNGHIEATIEALNDDDLDNAIKHLSDAIYWDGAKKRLEWLGSDLKCNPLLFRQARRATVVKGAEEKE